MNLDTITCADALTYLRSLPDGCVNCIVTSPPYFGLRDYGTAKWEGGDPACEHSVGNQVQDSKAPGAIMSGVRPGTDASQCRKCGAKRIDTQIGLEPTPAEYVAALVAVFREAKRVLRDDGVLWLNLGDSYGENKQLLMIPARVAIALQDDGWILRSDIVWSKGNPMPESVTDRPTKAHEYIFLFSKQPKYWYDAQAVSEPVARTWDEKNIGANNGWVTGVKEGVVLGRKTEPNGGLANSLPRADGLRNRRTVWTINPASFKGAHFATFPEEIPEICIKAGCPEWCCDQCGAPWVAQVETTGEWRAQHDRDQKHDGTIYRKNPGGGVAGPNTHRQTTHHGYAPSCACNAGKRPGVVFDPFMGAGTTALVAKRLNRRYLGCELNPAYVQMARDRIDGPLFAQKVEVEPPAPVAAQPTGPTQAPLFEEVAS